MFCKIISGAVRGVSGLLIQVEADVSEGLPGFHMVGMLSSEVREAEERVRTALKNSGFRLPPKRITVNLSPADIRKEGSLFDLPIAIAILVNLGIIAEKNVQNLLILGELSLDGTVNPVNGVLPVVYEGRKEGMRHFLLPEKNVREGAVLDGICCYGAANLREAVELLCGRKEGKEEKFCFEMLKSRTNKEDFSEVNGQKLLKRAAEIAAAGMHNMLMVGPPGAGKTMIAKRIAGILPALTMEESIELSKIYSAAGMLKPETPFMKERPFRSPHHTISVIGMTGGGRIPKPGEISLASFGVLFLDELPEFQKNTLEALRQPMENRRIMLNRNQGSYEFPANFLFLAAMNPCNCGYYPDRNQCGCSEQMVRRYLNRISRPLLDRIDICVEAQRITCREIQEKRKNESSETIRKRVEQAHQRQRERCHADTFNSALTTSQIKEFCILDREGKKLLEQAYDKLHLTARAYYKALRVARTIADLEGEKNIRKKHVSEAISYRGFSWGFETGMDENGGR